MGFFFPVWLVFKCFCIWKTNQCVRGFIFNLLLITTNSVSKLDSFYICSKSHTIHFPQRRRETPKNQCKIILSSKKLILLWSFYTTANHHNHITKHTRTGHAEFLLIRNRKKSSERKKVRRSQVCNLYLPLCWKQQMWIRVWSSFSRWCKLTKHCFEFSLLVGCWWF